ncbi:MAG: transglycosylase SLT domain-containing protein [Beijerinckiaceae bacterium]|nr:transglycosylase SLT domain-containing protein [Beijerinckiaceae bacterium]
MHAALAIAGRSFLFCSVLIGGAVITLPSSKVSFAAVPSSSVSLKMERQQISQPYLVGLRQFAPESTPASKVITPRTYFGSLNSQSFETEPHSGTLTYGSESITLPFDETTDTYAFGPMRLKHPLVKTIVHASYLAGVDPRLLMAIADKESSFIVSARASTSSATGLFQFIESTWLRAIRDFGPRFGLEREAALLRGLESSVAAVDAEDRARILELRNDPFLSTLMAAAMLRAEQEKLAGRLGRPISGAEVYLVHFLGPAGAEKFLAVLADKPKSSAANLLPKAAKANRPIFFATRKRKPQSLSVAQVHEKIESSLERRLSRYRQLDFGAVTAYAPQEASPELPGAPFARWRL